MMNKFQIGFGAGTMGCKTLGYCEREGRDPAEEHRRYAEFLTREGYDVISCEGGYARVAVDAGGIVRRVPAPPRGPALSAEDRDLLRTARSVVRDLAEGWPVKELAEDPRALCARLSALLGEEYDYDRSEVTSG